MINVRVSVVERKKSVDESLSVTIPDFIFKLINAINDNIRCYKHHNSFNNTSVIVITWNSNGQKNVVQK